MLVDAEQLNLASRDPRAKGLSARGIVLLFAMMSLAVLAGATIAESIPWTILLSPLLLLGLVLLAKSPLARLIWLIGGGFLVFQAPGTAIASRIIYLVGLLLSLALSSLDGRPNAVIPHVVRRLRTGSVVLAIAVMPGLLIGLATNEPPFVFRDSFSIILLIMAPHFGKDAGMALSPRAISVFVVLVGCIASMGFALDWLQRRGISALPVGRVVFASFILGLPAFLYCTARALIGKVRASIGWGSLALFITLGYLSTGTRATVALAAAIPTMLVGVRRHGHSRALLYVLGFLAAVGLLLPMAGEVASRDRSFLDFRLRLGVEALSGRLDRDPSFLIRKQAYQESFDRWIKRPLFGQGPGFTVSGELFNPDSPLSSFAKFGVFGVLGMGYFLYSLLSAARILAKSAGPGPAVLMVKGFIWIFIALVPLGSPFEDKGTPMAVALIIAALIAVSRQGSSYSTRKEWPEQDCREGGGPAAAMGLVGSA